MENEKYSKCDHCGTRDSSVEYVKNPYQEDMYDIIVYEYMCSDCYEASCGDI